MTEGQAKTAARLWLVGAFVFQLAAAAVAVVQHFRIADDGWRSVLNGSALVCMAFWAYNFGWAKGHRAAKADKGAFVTRTQMAPEFDPPSASMNPGRPS